jgi:carbon storage regulator
MLSERTGEPGTGMLYLNRRAGEAVIVNNAIEVRVVSVRGRTVRLGFSFPADASVLREEVFLQIRRENEAAALTAAQALTGLGPPHP